MPAAPQGELTVPAGLDGGDRRLGIRGFEVHPPAIPGMCSWPAAFISNFRGWSPRAGMHIISAFFDDTSGLKSLLTFAMADIIIEVALATIPKRCRHRRR